MMHNAGQDKKFWAEAVCTAVMIRNRSPTVSLDNMTPYEYFYGRKPDVSHFKVFGCKAYMHVPKENRKKWDSKTKKCIFVGYRITSKGYGFDTNDSDSMPDNEEEPQEINEPMPQATQEDQETIDNGESTSEETDVTQQQLGRSMRKREPPDKHGVSITALDNEYSAHIKNNTSTLTNLPEGRKAIDCR